METNRRLAELLLKLVPEDGSQVGNASLPFDAGDNRKVAVKIVDDRGIESLKIMNLD